MLWYLLGMDWLLLAVMTAISLLTVLSRHRPFGIPLLPAQSRQPVVLRMQRACAAVLSGFAVLNVLASCIVFFPFAKERADVILIAVLFVPVFGDMLILELFRRKAAKQFSAAGILFVPCGKATADLQVSREKGKAAISPLWLWILFALGFAPFIVFLCVEKWRTGYMLGFAGLMPLLQLLCIVQYYSLRNMPAPLRFSDRQKDFAFAKKTVHIRTAALPVMSAGILGFLWCFAAFLATAKPVFSLIGIVMLCAGMLAATIWQQRALEKLTDAGASDADAQPRQTAGMYKWGCYYNPNDPRVFVPKQVESLGWTLNLARPSAKVMLVGFWLLVVGTLLFAVLAGLMGDYRITLTESAVEIDASMYDLSVPYTEITEITTVDTLQNGVRTNGYGGFEKSFGHFHFDTYGDCMLYAYNDTPRFVVLRLQSKPYCVILNAQTVEQTDALCAEIKAQLPAA